MELKYSLFSVSSSPFQSFNRTAYGIEITEALHIGNTGFLF